MKKLFYLSLFIFSFSFCEGQSWIWAVDAVDSNLSTTSDPSSVTTDISGNIYETGAFEGSVKFGTKTINSGILGFTPYLAKYNSLGSVIWANCGILSNSHSVAYSFSVATDIFGNAVITGWFVDSVKLGSILLTTSTVYPTSFIAKYDTGGNVLWAECANNLNTNEPLSNSIATDIKGNAYITGNIVYGDKVIFGTDTIYGSAFLVKYSASGNVVWARGLKASLSGTISGNAVKTDDSGNVYVTGGFKDTAYLGIDTLKNNSLSSSDVFIVKYDSSGNILWATCAVTIGSSTAVGNAITVDNANNVYVSGEFNASVSFGSYNFLYSSLGNIFIEKYSPNGNLINAIASTPPTTTGNALYSIVSNKWNKVYLCGNFTNAIEFGSFNLVASAPSSTFIVEFDTALIASCGTIINDDNDDAQDGSYIAADPITDDVYLSGDGPGRDSITFGTTTLSGLYQEFAFLAKWLPCSFTERTNELKTKSESIKVFPNPSTGIFTLSLSHTELVSASPIIEVYNVMGQKVNFATPEYLRDNYTLNLSNQPNGVYFYRVLSENGALIGEGKVVIEK